MRAVELVAADGLTLRGEIWGGNGRDWLLLLHGVGTDLDAWRPLAGLVAEHGLSALALDLRGHGSSDDPWDERGAELDVDAAAAFARAEGADTFCIAAAGVAGLVALRAAERVRPDALALLSPGPLAGAGTADLRAPGVAKLVAWGALDARADRDAASVRAASIGWTVGASLPTAAQGTDLLAGEHAQQRARLRVRDVTERVGADQRVDVEKSRPAVRAVP
jgi:alpha-beta hydrolase superfamily lysophospholipase